MVFEPLPDVRAEYLCDSDQMLFFNYLKYVDMYIDKIFIIYTRKKKIISLKN